ncbi:22224_t:CDS:1, partial [Entrophospora sp. SA101]
MANSIGYNDFNHFTDLRKQRPYLYILRPSWLLVLSVTSQEKARYPHKFALELDCPCLDSEKYEKSFANLNTKILIPLNKLPFVTKKYRINLKGTHNCLNPRQLRELLVALEKYW